MKNQIQLLEYHKLKKKYTLLKKLINKELKVLREHLKNDSDLCNYMVEKLEKSLNEILKICELEQEIHKRLSAILKRDY